MSGRVRAAALMLAAYLGDLRARRLRASPCLQRASRTRSSWRARPWCRASCPRSRSRTSCSPRRRCPSSWPRWRAYACRDWITIPLSVLFRFFPTLGRGGARDRRCHADARHHPLCATAPLPAEYCPRPAHELRGVDRRGPVRCRSRPRARRGLAKRTNICSIGFGLADVAALAVSIAATAALACRPCTSRRRSRERRRSQGRARAPHGRRVVLLCGRAQRRRRRWHLPVACAGEVALLCGRSGCGKTTVTRLANGLAPHFYEGTGTGAVRVCGLDVTHAELWETARLVGSVFQNPKTPILQRRRPRRGRVRVREPGVRSRRYRAASVRRITRVRPRAFARRKPLRSLGRAEATRGVRERRGDIAQARRARRAVVQPRLRNDRPASRGDRALEGAGDGGACRRTPHTLPRRHCRPGNLP